jgi:hypothetical protein
MQAPSGDKKPAKTAHLKNMRTIAIAPLESPNLALINVTHLSSRRDAPMHFVRSSAPRHTGGQLLEAPDDASIDRPLFSRVCDGQAPARKAAPAVP